MEPFTESQLEGMYLGLLEAKPEELSLPLIAPTSSLILDAPMGKDERNERVKALQDRLEAGIEEDVEFDESSELEEVPLSTGLSDRLKLRRGVVDVPAVEPVSLPLKESASRNTLAKLEAYINEAGSEDSSEVSIVPLGMAVRSEWKDLIMSLVSSLSLSLSSSLNRILFLIPLILLIKGCRG